MYYYVIDRVLNLTDDITLSRVPDLKMGRVLTMTRVRKMMICRWWWWGEIYVLLCYI